MKSCSKNNKKITVAGAGYVGLSLAVLLAKNHRVFCVTTTPSKAEMINSGRSPIKDPEIESRLPGLILREGLLWESGLLATTDREVAYRNADMVVIATPTDYDPEKGFFDTSAVEDVIERVIQVNSIATIVIKSTVPVGYTERVREQYHTNRIMFSPEFLREGKALYDNLHPSRIIVGCSENLREEAKNLQRCWLLLRKKNTFRRL